MNVSVCLVVRIILIVLSGNKKSLKKMDLKKINKVYIPSHSLIIIIIINNKKINMFLINIIHISN